MVDGDEYALYLAKQPKAVTCSPPFALSSWVTSQKRYAIMKNSQNRFALLASRGATSRRTDLRAVQVCLLVGHVLTVAAALRALTSLPLTEKELFLGTFLLIALNAPLVAAGAALELLIRNRLADT
jgi:hypothetical protein